MNQVAIIFAALSQKTRLRAYRLLVQVGPEGLAAGEISKLLKVPHNTMSFHLHHLSQSGVVLSKRVGRSVIYAVNFAVVKQFITFLVEDCCSGDASKMKLAEYDDCCITELAESVANAQTIE